MKKAMPVDRTPRRLIVAFVGIALVVGGFLAVRGFVPGGGTDSIPEGQVTAAAMAALRGQYAALHPTNDAQVRSLFSGKALAKELALRGHVQDLIATGQDYPGDLVLTSIQILDMYGDANVVTLDVAAHGKLSNMKSDKVVDYSESDVVYHLVLTRDNGAWKVTDLSWEFAPGGMQP